MNRLLFLLIAFGAVGKPFARINKEASEQWPSKCNPPLVSDSEKPDLEDLKLDEVLSSGVFHLNLQNRRASNNSSHGATFVFGIPGSGKSIVTSLIMGDLEKLRIGLSTSNSSIIYRTGKPFGFKNTKWMLMELLPEFYAYQYNNFTKEGFWDCPGFDNSRGTKADIAEMYFLRHALQITKKAKFIFTITHSSLKNESGLRMLATYATTLLKDIGKFKDSIGLVVTEVDGGSYRGDEDILLSITSFLKTYIDKERDIIKMEVGNKPDDKEHNQRLQRIEFVEGLLLKGVDGISGQFQRMNFIRDLNDCGTLPNMSVVWDVVAKLRILVNTLKYSTIGPADFGWKLRNATLQEIGETVQKTEERGLDKYAIESARGIMKMLGRTLLSSQNEIPMIELINGFHNAFDRHFGQLYGKSHVLEWNRVGRLDPMYAEIDLFMTCASQRMRTTQFFQEVIKGSNNEVFNVPVSSEPFRIAHVGLNDLSVFYNFFNNTYHALGIYSTQVALLELKKFGIINVNQDTVPNILANVSVDVPGPIRAIWKHTLGRENKKYLIDLVRKHIPEHNFSCTHQGLHHPCRRMDYYGRNVMLSEAQNIYDASVNSCGRPNPNPTCSYEMSIVALEKVYIDTTFDAAKYISIVAPVWEVIESETDKRVREINSGGSCWGVDFEKWCRGGYIFGVYSDITNSAELLITANGDPSRGDSKSGIINLISTGRNITVLQEACPGSHQRYNEDEYMPAHGITDYNKEYVRNSLLDCFSSSESNKFFRDIAPYYAPISTLALVTELEAAERDYYARGNYNNIHNCPGKLKTRLLEYYERTLGVIKKQLINAGPDDKLALTLVAGFLQGKLTSYRGLDATLNVDSTDEYLSAVEDELEELEKLDYKVATQKRTEECKGALDDKVDEAHSLIMNVIMPAIESGEQALKLSQKKLSATLEAFFKETKHVMKQPEEMKEVMEFLLPPKGFLNILNEVGTVMRYLAPVSPKVSAAGGIAMYVRGIGNYFLDEYLGVPPMTLSFQLPADSKEDYQAASDNYFERQKIKKSEEERKRIARVTRLLSPDPGQILFNAVFFKAICESEKELEKMEMAIATADKQISGIQYLQEKFTSTFVPALDGINKSIGTVTANLNGTSQSGLLVKKWGILSMLKNMRGHIKRFAGWVSKAQDALLKAGKEVVGVPGIYETLQESIDNIQEPFEVLLQLYTQIEMYQERKELAQFIADLNSTDIGTVVQIKNVELREAVKRIEVSIKVNIVLEEYKRATHAFKQWVFPFPSLYLTAKNDLIGKAATTFEGVVNSCKKEISQYRINLKKYNALSTTRDKYVHFYNFTTDTKPFYTWTNAKWQNAIGRLLKGESIRLKADVDMTGQENAHFFKDKAAIKFKSIGISINAHDKSRQDELNTVLKQFRMDMDHSGMSHYNVNGQQFVMRDKAQSYRYNFEGNVGQNTVKNHVEGPNSDFLTGPYTSWTFKLRNLTKRGFADLAKFASNVDLALEGSATYLDESEAGTVALSELNLSEYYETYLQDDDETLIDVPPELSLRGCNRAQMFHKRSSQSTSENSNQAPSGRNLRSNGNSTKKRRCTRYDTTTATAGPFEEDTTTAGAIDEIIWKRKLQVKLSPQNDMYIS